MSASGKFLWSFVAELWPCSQGHVTAHLMQMFTLVDLFSCFSTSMISVVIRDEASAYGNEPSAMPADDPRTGHVTSSCMTLSHAMKKYVNNSSQNRGRAMGEMSLCLSRQDASTNMQYDLSGSSIRSGNLTWPKVKFSNWPFGIKMHNVSMSLNERKTMVFRVFLYLS